MDAAMGSVGLGDGAELENLRRRAYGPDADIAGDFAAQARLAELEAAQRAARAHPRTDAVGGEAPAQTSPTASSSLEGGSPPRGHPEYAGQGDAPDAASVPWRAAHSGALPSGPAASALPLPAYTPGAHAPPAHAPPAHHAAHPVVPLLPPANDLPVLTSVAAARLAAREAVAAEQNGYPAAPTALPAPVPDQIVPRAVVVRRSVRDRADDAAEVGGIEAPLSEAPADPATPAREETSDPGAGDLTHRDEGPASPWTRTLEWLRESAGRGTPWWRGRRGRWLIGGGVAAVLVVFALATALTPRPDATLAIRAAQPTEAPEQLSRGGLFGGLALSAEDVRLYDEFRGLGVWTGPTENGTTCIVVTNSEGSPLNFNCAPPGLDPTADVVRFQNQVGGVAELDALWADMPIGSVIRFIVKGDRVDVWLHPARGPLASGR